MTTVKITSMTKTNGNVIYLYTDFIIIFYWSILNGVLLVLLYFLKCKSKNKLTYALPDGVYIFQILLLSIVTYQIQTGI